MRARPLRALSALVLVVLPALAACDDAPAPEPGFVTVSLTSPAGAEGAAVFRVEGQEVTRGESDEGFVFVRQATDGARIVVVRETPGPLTFRMQVENVHQSPRVEVLEVAGPDDAVRPSLAGYRVEVQR